MFKTKGGGGQRLFEQCLKNYGFGGRRHPLCKELQELLELVNDCDVEASCGLSHPTEHELNHRKPL